MENVVRLTVKLFLADNEDFVLGPGVIELLRFIKELGSLRKAVDRMGISYRWAWGRLNKTEEALGVPLFSRPEPGGYRRPIELTHEAQELLDWLSTVAKEVQRTLTRMEDRMPPCITARREQSGEDALTP